MSNSTLVSNEPSWFRFFVTYTVTRICCKIWSTTRKRTRRILRNPHVAIPQFIPRGSPLIQISVPRPESGIQGVVANSGHVFTSEHDVLTSIYRRALMRAELELYFKKRRRERLGWGEVNKTTCFLKVMTFPWHSGLNAVNVNLLFLPEDRITTECHLTNKL